MTMQSSSRKERLHDLLADRALFGTDLPQQMEIEELLSEFPDVRADEYDLCVAALDSQTPAIDEMPPDLKQRLKNTDWKQLADGLSGEHTRAPQPTSTFRIVPWTGWLAAAAAILLWIVTGGRTETAVDPQSVLDAADVRSLDWTPTEHPNAASLGGKIVWSLARQQGFMELRGLEVNDPAVAQYQLWIMDDSQAHPIDGGVFDVTAESCVIPISAKLPMDAPTMFAITLEKPGGVVVSSQSDVIALAKS